MKFYLVILTLGAMFVAPARANMIQNPGFEDEGRSGAGSALNWRINEPDDHGDAWGSAIRADWRAHGGLHIAAIRGTWAGAGDYGGLWQEVEITPGSVYRGSAWFWADGVWSAATQELKIEFWDVGRGTKLGEVVNAFNDISEMWMEKSVEGHAPEGAFWARIVINASGVGAGGALQVDDISLEPVP